MGLDMYLHARKRGAGEYPKELEKFNPEYRCVESEYAVGYWYKANAIHGWFVRNLAYGQCDWDELAVGITSFKRLERACVAVLKDHTKAPKLLPVEEGAFFGSQQYGDEYFKNVLYTRDLCRKAIALINKDPGWQFFYRASW